jgi:hypothetical protein
MIIKEDNKSTLQANRVAVTVYKKFIALVKSLPTANINQPPFFRISFQGKIGYGIEVSEFAPESPLGHIVLLPRKPGQIANLSIFMDRATGKARTAVMLLILGQRPVLNLKFLASQEVQEYFVHEYIHCLDYYREKSPVNVESYPHDENGMIRYYNSPKEFNAYFHEGLNRIHNNILGIAKHKHQATWFRVYPTFSKFLTEIIYSFESGFIESLNPEYRRKFIKRLHQYYDFIADKWRNYRA